MNTSGFSLDGLKSEEFSYDFLKNKLNQTQKEIESFTMQIGVSPFTPEETKLICKIYNNTVKLYCSIIDRNFDGQEKNYLTNKVLKIDLMNVSAKDTVEYLSSRAEGVDPRIEILAFNLLTIEKEIKSDNITDELKKKIDKTSISLNYYKNVLVCERTQNEISKLLEKCNQFKQAIKSDQKEGGFENKHEAIARKTLERFNRFAFPEKNTVFNQSFEEIQSKKIDHEMEISHENPSILLRKFLLTSQPHDLSEVSGLELISKLRKYLLDFIGNGEETTFMERVYFHLYYIHKNEEINISGYDKFDLQYGEKVFGLGDPSLQANKLRAMQRTYVEFLLLNLKDSITNDYNNGFITVCCKALEELKLDSRDTFEEKNVAHLLYELTYLYNHQQNSLLEEPLFNYEDSFWKGDFGRIAFLEEGNEIISKSDKLKAVNVAYKIRLKTQWGITSN